MSAVHKQARFDKRIKTALQSSNRPRLVDMKSGLACRVSDRGRWQTSAYGNLRPKNCH